MTIEENSVSAPRGVHEQRSVVPAARAAHRRNLHHSARSRSRNGRSREGDGTAELIGWPGRLPRRSESGLSLRDIASS
jgi:hypothetical protein